MMGNMIRFLKLIMEMENKMNKVTSEIKESIIHQLQNLKWVDGDTGDIGNEVGIALAKTLQVFKNLNKEEVDAFISGIKHGVSLIDGSH